MGNKCNLCANPDVPLDATAAVVEEDDKKETSFLTIATESPPSPQTPESPTPKPTEVKPAAPKSPTTPTTTAPVKPTTATTPPVVKTPEPEKTAQAVEPTPTRTQEPTPTRTEESAQPTSNEGQSKSPLGDGEQPTSLRVPTVDRRRSGERPLKERSLVGTTSAPTATGMFKVSKTDQIPMPTPKQKDAAPIMDTKGPRGVGGYLTFEWMHQGACFVEWRKDQVEKAFLYAKPNDDRCATMGLKPVPEHRFKGKKQVVSQNIQADADAFYRGVCNFVKQAATHGCDIEMLATGKPTSPKELMIFTHDLDKVSTVTWGGDFDPTAADAVAAGPTSGINYREQMTLNEFISWGTSIGGALRLK